MASEPETLTIAGLRRVVVLVTGAFAVGGGIATVNRLILKALSEWKGGQTHLTVRSLGDPPSTALDPYYVDPSRTDWSAFGGRTLAFALSAWRAVVLGGPDLVIADHVGIASVLYPLARAHLCRYMVVCHGLEVSEELLSLRRRLALRAAHRCLAVSPTTRDRVEAAVPGVRAVVHELALDPRLGLDPTRGRALREISLRSVSGMEHRIGDRMVLCVGRMWRDQRHKGQDALIAAMPRLRACFADAQLVLAGQGDWVPELEALALGKGVGDGVIMPGFVEDDLLDALYARCAVFALPSRGEGFGLVYLQAMRWAKPCVGGSQDSARDVIVHGETGILLPEPHDPAALAEAIGALLADPDLARRMGEAGRRRLEAGYLFPHFCERFYAAIGWS